MAAVAEEVVAEAKEADALAATDPPLTPACRASGAAWRRVRVPPSLTPEVAAR